MIYFIVFLVIAYGCYKYDYNQVNPNSRQYKRLERIAFLLLVLVPGLSYRIGVDTPSYMIDFAEAPTLGNFTWNYLKTEGSEPLWLIFMSICKTICPNYAFMHTIQCLIYHSSLLYMIKRFTPMHFTVLLFYLVVAWVHISFGALRESIAVAFYFIGITRMLQKDSIKLFILWSIPALLAHQFAFVIVSITTAVYLYRRSRLLSISIITVAAGLFIYRIDDFILMMAYNDDVQRRMLFYMESNTEGDITMSFIGTMSYIVQLVIPPSALIYLDRKRMFIPSNYKLILFIAILLGVIASFLSDFRRLYYYVYPFVMICFTLYYNDQRTKVNYGLNKIIHNGLIVVLAFIIYSGIVGFCRPTIVETRSNVKYNVFYFPYHSVFTEEKDPNREYLNKY